MRVVVVGGGVVGTTIALELATAGIEVTLLERDANVGGGASRGNAGYLCPSHAAPLPSPAALRAGLRWLFLPGSPLTIRPRPAALPWLAQFVAACTPARAERALRYLRPLALQSLDLHASLAARGVATGFERRGILNLYETERGLRSGAVEAEHAARAGMRAAVLDARDVRALEPAIAAPVAGGVFYEDDAQCDPAAYADAVAGAARRAGAEIVTSAEAVRMERRGSRVTRVETTRGDFDADEVVLAAGVWTRDIARTAGLALRLEPAYGYHVDVRPAESQPTVPVFLQEARVTTTSFADRFRVTGMLELSGRAGRVEARRVDAIVRAAARVFGTSAVGEIVEVWRGPRPCCPDGLPAIARAPGLDNVVVATGHSTLGLTLAPLTGVLVRELLLREPPTADLRPLGLQPSERRGALAGTAA